MMLAFKFSFTEEAITERRPTIRTCSIGESSPMGYAATRSAHIDRGSSRRIDSLACSQPAYISVSIVAKPGRGLRSSMGKPIWPESWLLRNFKKKGNWSCPYLTGHSISAQGVSPGLPQRKPQRRRCDRASSLYPQFPFRCIVSAIF